MEGIIDFIMHAILMLLIWGGGALTGAALAEDEPSTALIGAIAPIAIIFWTVFRIGGACA